MVRKFSALAIALASRQARPTAIICRIAATWRPCYSRWALVGPMRTPSIIPTSTCAGALRLARRTRTDGPTSGGAGPGSVSPLYGRCLSDDSDARSASCGGADLERSGTNRYDGQSRPDERTLAALHCSLRDRSPWFRFQKERSLCEWTCSSRRRARPGGMHRPARWLVGVLAVVFAAPGVRAADPQPYSVTIAPTKIAPLDRALKASSQLVTLR